MSRARRSKVHAREQHREQAARFIEPHATSFYFRARGPSLSGDIDPSAIGAILDGNLLFDVHAVREAAEWQLEAARFAGVGCRLWPRHLPSWAPSWRWRVRLAQRVLDALEGQPSECGCKPSGVTIDGDALRYRPSGFVCTACKGTGHNLRGFLPPVEWSAQVRRRMREVYVYRSTHNPRSWLDDIPRHSLNGPDATRVAPRGMHRAILFGCSPRGAEQALSDRAVLPRHVPPDDRVPVSICRGWPLRAWLGALRGGGLGPWRHDAHVVARQMSRLPRWRRGELLHARQRRDRAAYVKV